METVTFICIPILGKEGGGVVWDREAGKALARFNSNGLFTTNNPETIEKLMASGFKTVTETTEHETETDEKPKRRGNRKGNKE